MSATSGAAAPRPTYLAERRDDVHDVAPWSPFAYVGRRLRELVGDLLVGADAPEGATVLDYGCAEQPYRDLLPAWMTYLGADLPGNPLATVAIGPTGRLAIDDASVDVVLSTQVLEHVADPAGYLAECRRVLKPGGSLVLTTHGIMYYHRDPEDYWRWTCDGLQRIVEDAGLEVADLRGVLSLVGASLQLLQDGMGHKVPRRLRKAFIVVLQKLIALADRRTTEDARRANGLVLGVRAVAPH